MSLIRFKPTNELGFFRTFEDEMDRFFGRTRLYPEISESLAVDIYQDGNEYRITADVPGMEKGDITVKVEDGLLTIRGEKKLEHEEKKENYHLQERFYGAFSRTIRLPKNVDQGKVSAETRNGVLEITLPKTEDALPKMVEVKVS